MGCFSIPQQHRRRPNVPSPSPSSSSSSLTIPASVKNLLELRRDACLPHHPLHHASSCGMCTPSWSFRSRAALLNSASFKLAKDHPRALTGSHSLTDRVHERSQKSSISFSAPIYPSGANEECLFPLPLPPTTDDATSMSSSPASPTLSSNAGLSASSSIVSPSSGTNNVADTFKERSSTSSSSSGASSLSGSPSLSAPSAVSGSSLSPASTPISSVTALPTLTSSLTPAPVPAPTSSSTSAPSTLMPVNLSSMSSFPSLQWSISSPSSSSSTSMACPLPLPPPALSGLKLREYTYDELAGACQIFAPQFFIRDGGSGPVFRAIVKDELDHTVEVAVTCLTHVHMQSYKRWRAEVGSLARLSHPHLCKVVGFCGEDPASSLRTPVKVGVQERDRYLVYEHTANGSLESLLYGRLDKAPLNWASRLRIATGAAQGLAYLHDRIPRQVIYKSFKALNIQVDKEFNAKLSDFGFTRCFKEVPSASPAFIIDMDDNYAAPETRAAGELSHKSNVWSFGVVLLELLTGRQNMDEIFPAEERDLIQWTRPHLLDAKRLYLIVDPELKGRYSTGAAKLLADLALECLSEDPVERPSMRQVAALLSSVAPSLKRGSTISGYANCNNSNIGNGHGNPAKWKSKSYNLASILASPARSFNSSLQQQQQQQQPPPPNRMRFRGFLSGEMPKEVSRSISAAMDHQGASRNLFMSRYGFHSGEILQGSLPSASPLSTNGYFPPPPRGRSVASGVTTLSG